MEEIFWMIPKSGTQTGLPENSVKPRDTIWRSSLIGFMGAFKNDNQNQ